MKYKAHLIDDGETGKHIITPVLERSNCLFHMLLTCYINRKYNLWIESIKPKVTWNKRRFVPSFYCVVDDTYRIGYRSRPKGNGLRIWFDGRTQITRLKNAGKK